jgi:hypothetical protein
MAIEAQWINKKGEPNKPQTQWATENKNIGALSKTMYFPPDDTPMDGQASGICHGRNVGRLEHGEN